MTMKITMLHCPNASDLEWPATDPSHSAGEMKMAGAGASGLPTENSK
jgi:hypothetical protein